MSQPQPACLSDPTEQASELDVSSFTGPTGHAVLDHKGRLLSANSQLAELLGHAPPATGTLDPFKLAIDDRSATELAHALAEADVTHLDITFTDGARRHVQLGRLQACRRLLLVTRAGETIASNDRIEQDALTGLANRHRLNEALSGLEAERALRQSRSGTNAVDEGKTAILLIDIDHFKQINDTLGHAIGDSLLRLVSGRLRRVTRERDDLIRIGGDEFLLILPADESSDDAEKLADRIAELLSRPFLVDGQQINIGVSIGIAVFDDATADGPTLLQHADLALQQAKLTGRNRACSFEPQMAQQAMRRRALEIDMRRAMALQQFRLVYQPQVDLHSGRLVGFEALLRWEHPERGMVSPAEFIPIAEETGEIRRIGAWVILQACQQASFWPDGLSVAVNVSPLQFDDGKLLQHVRTALSRSGLDPERLEVEVTEGLLFHNPEAALEQLTELRELRVDIAMDDFGTGYASLSHLSRFPFTKVKIDQSFVRGAVDDRTQALVDCIIGLGNSLGMKTLAEGVETPEQYQRLQDSGCDAVQGYLVSRPMEADSIADFLIHDTGQLPAGDAAA
ncbi:putative bifunctional diguanylate cyclase/phosphodiesterase [Granulosicoccus sp. 3-233]|uniref:putative bifunctional diguanylate cyclase/phosphodiesterase n=1 Tax=Granulosicoccus sp. 3-233 TaxID=3417969 RepID=UPI003D34DC31